MLMAGLLCGLLDDSVSVVGSVGLRPGIRDKSSMAYSLPPRSSSSVYQGCGHAELLAIARTHMPLHLLFQMSEYSLYSISHHVPCDPVTPCIRHRC